MFSSEVGERKVSWVVDLDLDAMNIVCFPACENAVEGDSDKGGGIWFAIIPNGRGYCGGGFPEDLTTGINIVGVGDVDIGRGWVIINVDRFQNTCGGVVVGRFDNPPKTRVATAALGIDDLVHNRLRNKGGLSGFEGFFAHAETEGEKGDDGGEGDGGDAHGDDDFGQAERRRKAARD